MHKTFLCLKMGFGHVILFAQAVQIHKIADDYFLKVQQGGEHNVIHKSVVWFNKIFLYIHKTEYIHILLTVLPLHICYCYNSII